MPNMQPIRMFLLALAMGLWGVVMAGGPVTWTFAATALGSDTVQVLLTADCGPGWHIYALDLQADEGPLPTVITLGDGKAYHLAGALMAPPATEAFDTAFAMPVKYHAGKATFTQNIRRTTTEAFMVSGTVEYMACNDRTCLPPKTVEFTLNVPPSLH
ncbi:MAG TPA: protein-disulfide reductase DsbD family protein [Flavobacteriales bacterium]|nr:protein-disulfide reductase DsbD family protein [Flavobacteriales bacterium]HRP81498.1 protein-disulfide reductase DsbD family protein [Flavobacteriales bacterium]HRQ83825.1 protein-disulfide reductase DsbD family protein [Flavobacteriales bacterium]